MSWIQTYSGLAFRPMAPDADTVHIIDIAHALSMICRFNGHTRQFYSVAEHSVRMSEEVHPDIALDALLHDAAEAYVSDVARPIKPHLANFKEIEENILRAIYCQFGLAYPLSMGTATAIKVADLRMLATERLQLMALHAPDWDSLKGVAPYCVQLECWPPDVAEAKFLNRFAELNKQLPTSEDVRPERACCKCGVVLPPPLTGPQNLPPFSCSTDECRAEAKRIRRLITGVA